MKTVLKHGGHHMHRAARATYDISADQFSQHYDQIGARDGDIELAFALAGNPVNARVLEIGCGNGRDARAIMHLAADYTGIDISEKMLSIARDRLLEGNFEHADATKYNYKGPYDVVFAFALIRHLDLEELTDVLRAVYQSLRPGGVFYISSNYGVKYEPIDLPSPVGGTRRIYTYNPNIIQKHSPSRFRLVYQTRDIVDGREWFEVALQKAV